MTSASRNRPPSIASLLLSAAGDAQLLADDRGDAHAFIKEPGGSRLLRVRSRAFRYWLVGRAEQLYGVIVGPGAVSTACLHLEARASARGGPGVTLWNRVARGTDGAIWLDLLAGSAVRVTAQGWSVVADPPPLFRRFSHQLPLPAPVPGGDLRALDRFLMLRTEDDRLLYHTSLAAALLPDIAHPIVMMHGAHGGAKTTAARLWRHVIDPSKLKTVIVGRQADELVQALFHHYMPVLDNRTRVVGREAEVLCQASTGAGFTKRAAYTEQEDVIFTLCRPMVLTGIELPSLAADIVDRMLLIGVERLAGPERRDEGSLWREFEQQRPLILGGLLEVLSRAMAIEPRLELPALERMADFTRWGAAAAEAMGIGAPRFCEALARNTVRQGEKILEDDPLAEAVGALLQRVGRFSGSATELLLALKLLAGPHGKAGLPPHAGALGKRLSGLRTALATLGIEVRAERQADSSRQRRWIIEGPGGEGAAGEVHETAM